MGAITSERRAASDWNRWAAYVRIRKQGAELAAHMRHRPGYGVEPDALRRDGVERRCLSFSQGEDRAPELVEAVVVRAHAPRLPSARGCTFVARRLC